MFKNGTLKLCYIGSRTKNSFKLLSVQTSNVVPNKNASSHKDVGANNEEDVLVKDFGNTGIITLNRPKALNSLNLSMIEKIYPTLKKWEISKKLVVIEGVGEKAFCAGGDIKAIALAADENKELRETFFRKEYIQNHLIGTYIIPYVALMNGITMGGGVGLSVHGKYRVATEKTLFAMPETAIGLFPDVGGSYFLPRLQGRLGVYLGLTGERLKGIDVLHAGIATHIVPSENLSQLKQDLLTSEFPDVTTVLNKYQLKNLDKQFALAPYMKQIERCFSASSVEEIIKRLEEDKSEWAEKTIQTLLKMSPTSLKVALLAMKKGSTLNLAECLKMEYRLACNLTICKTTDFYEGVRAVVIDKDQNPKWKPKDLSDVSDAYVNKQFENFPQEKDLLL
ncbi:3-hydroxyisobutyryl-CoA hydrolase isoform X2 [Megalopta genalis]|uniref:3-hydroxyisobutyryl-CoA hydrolase isoform X2 n=1 Tax=Megalopta genalis TaxID=115081 RepID=UPI003FCF80CF